MARSLYARSTRGGQAATVLAWLAYILARWLRGGVHARGRQLGDGGARVCGVGCTARHVAVILGGVYRFLEYATAQHKFLVSLLTVGLFTESRPEKSITTFAKSQSAGGAQ